jgi:MOSC domain-containing protein YiiM
MKENIGTILGLFISIEGSSKRINKKSINVDEKGILIDKFYDKDIQRSILLSSQKAYDLLKNNNIEASYGAIGENIVLSINPYDLDIGTKILLGNAVLEITQHCTLCSGLKSIDRTAPKLLKDDRGVFAKVIESGTICENDTISILDS